MLPAGVPLDPDLDAMPMELVARPVMRRDGISEDKVRDVIPFMPLRGRYNAIAER